MRQGATWKAYRGWYAPLGGDRELVLGGIACHFVGMGAEVRLDEGQIIAERYRVVEFIAVGGMGAVYRVEHIAMAKMLAMKVIHPELATNPEITKRFEREAQAVAQLDSPHIVRVTDFGAADGLLFLTMELVLGTSLKAHIASRQRLSVGEALGIVDQLLVALAHAHRRGILHRDLKPENIMLVEGDHGLTVKVLDFGLARLTRDTHDESQLTRPGMVFGTPRYMAPEQAAAEAVDARTDLYALGIVLYEMLVGEPPFTGQSALEVLKAQMVKEPPLVTSHLGSDAAYLDAILKRALAKAKEDRYESAEDFQASLPESAFRAPLPTRASVDVPSSVLPGFAKRGMFRSGVDGVRRHPRLAIMGALGLFFSLALVMAPEILFSVRYRNIRTAMILGKLDEAQKQAEALATKSPRDERVHLLRGHIAFLNRDYADAEEAYSIAMKLEGAAGADPELLANTKKLVGTKPKAGYRLVRSISLHGGPEASSFLQEMVHSGPDRRIRRRAYRGLVRLGAEDHADALPILLKDLKATADNRCETRKWYVEQLVGFDDPRVSLALKRELARKGGFFDFGGVNGCMEVDLKKYLKARASR